MRSPDDWWRRIEDKRAVAVLFKDGDHRAEAWDACGLAAEFAFKAVIHKREAFPFWPGRSSGPDYHTHDLGRLMRLAGLSPADLPSPIRPRLKVVLSWDVGHRYRAEPPPRLFVLQMFDATFGREGIVPWLKTL